MAFWATDHIRQPIWPIRQLSWKLIFLIYFCNPIFTWWKTFWNVGNTFCDILCLSIDISCSAEHHQSGETNNNHETINEASGSGTGTNPGGSGVTSTNFGTISSTSTNLVHQSTEESNGGSYAMIDLDKTHAIAALNAGQSNPTDEGIYFPKIVHKCIFF